ncbi:MAG TPA: hypothetical protein VNZ03_04715 [Terriglobales bacterium]|jgi:hypothetical protein|nr:hypothetical protein [Terriglobales bacterium]
MCLAKVSKINWVLVGILSILVYWFTNPSLVYAQKGQNAVMSGTTSQVSSYAFVDLTPYGLNICQSITHAFTDYASSKRIVIDARGLSGTALTCATGDANPWSGTSLASIVLLPAGTITIYNTWILPSDTRLTGEGPTLTAIQAGTGFTTSTDPDIIDMGSTNGICGNPVDCQAVVVEHLALVNQNTSATINGIVNCCSQELSYVDDLALSNITGIGVEITGGGGNSGPYSRLAFSGSGTCINISGSPQTRGVHGLTCFSSGSSGALIYVDAENNSFDDVILQGGPAQDGIRIGYNSVAVSNIFRNVRGYGLLNVIHIPNNNSNVGDLTFLGTARSSGTNTITDELTSLASTPLTDANVGMYLIGQAVQASGSGVGYSRFTTSTSANFPTWIVGPNPPINPCATGSLFSCNSTLGNCVSPTHTLWGCANGAWSLIK